ncbi:MAG: SAP domain-containing protein, partial [Treponemataceae bacterium]|nr:SAP domain-containing protein [Treponemataceae bacterium]
MKQTPLPVVSMMVLACSLLLGLAGGLWALDGTEGGDTATGALPSLQQGGASEESRGTPPLTKEQQILEMDIATSSLLELASWCRRLGLSEGGTREELQNRLREYYRIPLSKGSDASGKEQTSSSEKPENPEKSSSPRTIVIESAEQSEFFTLDVVNEEYARLRGKVQVTIKEGDTSYTLSAEELLYNKTRNQLSARGNVIYTKKKGEVTETFRGTALSLNLDSLSG